MGKVKKTKKFDRTKFGGKINPDIPDRSNDPYFVKKANEMKEFLKKHPIPEEILKGK